MIDDKKYWKREAKWGYWISGILFAILVIALIFSGVRFNKMEDLEYQLSECQEIASDYIPFCEDIIEKYETNYVRFLGEDCFIAINGKKCKFENCEVIE